MKLSAPSQGFQATSGTASSVSSAAFPLIGGLGTAAAPTYALDANSGMYGRDDTVTFSCGGTGYFEIQANSAYICGSNPTLGFLGSIAGAALTNLIASTAVLSVQNGTTAQEFRVYGNTTGSKYVEIHHNGTDAHVGSSSGSINFVLPSIGGAWQFNATTARLIALANFGFTHGTSALATNATEGFFHLQSCAGAPNGTPASIPTGQLPTIIDSTNKKLYIYLGAAWIKAQVAGVDVIFG